jgi:hypothetical protein
MNPLIHSRTGQRQLGTFALLLLTLTASAAAPPDGGVSGLQGLAQG